MTLAPGTETVPVIDEFHEPEQWRAGDRMCLLARRAISLEGDWVALVRSGPAAWGYDIGVRLGKLTAEEYQHETPLGLARCIVDLTVTATEGGLAGEINEVYGVEQPVNFDNSRYEALYWGDDLPTQEKYAHFLVHGKVTEYEPRGNLGQLQQLIDPAHIEKTREGHVLISDGLHVMRATHPTALSNEEPRWATTYFAGDEIQMRMQRRSGLDAAIEAAIITPSEARQAAKVAYNQQKQELWDGIAEAAEADDPATFRYLVGELFAHCAYTRLPGWERPKIEVDITPLQAASLLELAGLCCGEEANWPRALALLVRPSCAVAEDLLRINQHLRRKEVLDNSLSMTQEEFLQMMLDMTKDKKPSFARLSAYEIAAREFAPDDYLALLTTAADPARIGQQESRDIFCLLDRFKKEPFPKYAASLLERIFEHFAHGENRWHDAQELLRYAGLFPDDESRGQGLRSLRDGLEEDIAKLRLKKGEMNAATYDYQLHLREKSLRLINDRVVRGRRQK